MRQELEQTIEQLRQQIADVGDLSHEEAQELRMTLDGIAHSVDDRGLDSAQLAKHFQRRVEAFEDSHPVLVNTVGRLADTLSQMGI